MPKPKFKLKDLITIGTTVGDIFTGGAVSKVTDLVKDSIDDPKDPTNVKGLEAVAQVDDIQNQAIVLLDRKVEELKAIVASQSQQIESIQGHH